MRREGLSNWVFFTRLGLLKSVLRLGQFHGVLALLDLLGAVTLSLGREMFEGTTDVE